MNKVKIVTSISAVVLALSTLFFLSSQVYATQQGNPWSEWEDTSSCQPNSCGTDEGTKTQERTREVCDTECPVVHFEWTTEECPAGYSPWIGDWCEKNGHQFDLKKMVVTEHSADVAYEKSQDPNKCHRPSDNDLKDQYGMDNEAKNDFKEENPQWKGSIKVNCTEESEEQTISCTVPEEEVYACEEEPVYGCTDEEALNYNEEATVDDESCEYIEETPESTPSAKPEKENTFHPDTRCLDTTPPAPTWFVGEDGSTVNDWHPVLTWSAMGGDTVEIRFSENPSDLRWRFTTNNDGHLIGGYVDEHNTGLLGMIDYYYQLRVINGCKVGPWSDTIEVFN